MDYINSIPMIAKPLINLSENVTELYIKAPQSVSFPIRLAVTQRLNTEVIALPEPEIYNMTVFITHYNTDLQV